MATHAGWPLTASNCCLAGDPLKSRRTAGPQPVGFVFVSRGGGGGRDSFEGAGGTAASGAVVPSACAGCCCLPHGLQGADTAYRAEGFKENNILKNPATGMWLDMGGTYSNFTARVMAEERLASVPAAAAVNNARVDVVTTSLEYIKGFWPWEDLTYRCYTKMDVDPAVTGATWVDSVLRRAAPMHKIVLPPPGVMPNGKLSVFLPDFGKSPADYTELLETAASTGAVAIGLAYLNGIEVSPRRDISVKCVSHMGGGWARSLYATPPSPPRVLTDSGVGARAPTTPKFFCACFPFIKPSMF